MSQDTRTRIRDTAERLFAEQGVDAVSVRAILNEAGVNVALAHYHFGSREGLIEEILRSSVAPMAARLVRALDEVDALGPGASLEDLLRAYYGAVTRTLATRPHAAKLFVQLQNSANPALRAMGDKVARPYLYKLADVLKKWMPGVAADRFLLRLLLVASAPNFFVGHWDLVMQSARRRISPDALPTPETLADELVTFCAAGLRAGLPNAGGT